MKYPSPFPYLLTLLLAYFACAASSEESTINREQVVRRHQVQIQAFNKLDSLSVGNGTFAFTVDPTGLQTYPEFFEKGVCLGTMSEWGWHHFPNTANYERSETTKLYPTGKRMVPYAIQKLPTERQKQAADYYRKNPHRLHLGIFGFQFSDEKGEPIAEGAIEAIHQILDPWTGEIHSRFNVCGESVEVITLCDPDTDSVAFQIASPLLNNTQLQLRLRFPYPTGQHTDSGGTFSSEFNVNHHSELLSDQPLRKVWLHTLNDTRYQIALQLSSSLSIKTQNPHDFLLTPAFDGEKTQCLRGILTFSPQLPNSNSCFLPAADFTTVRERNAQHWHAFWNEGGIVDFEGSTDPRALELERRIILSRYLTRIQCAGKLPPQETGLTFNSWFGKFHLEMHWWHGVHWALWDQPALLEKSLPYYQDILPVALSKAETQGFTGVRWPKMTDPSGADSPSDVGEFLIWQQPHFIYYAETLYQLKPDTQLLETYADLVFKTADFMSDIPIWNENHTACHLAPPLIPAQERLPKLETYDPAFELRYWKWALKTAQQWRERLQLAPDSNYQQVIDGLPDNMATHDGLYLAAASAPDSYTNAHYMSDHPMVLGAIGMLPLDHTISQKTAEATFKFISEQWDWPSTWGWDYPMMAMAATRLGRPEAAVDALLMDMQKNTYLPNGHNYQDARLRIYLPGNGALLTAVAMMCAGFDGCETTNPGFPTEGWNVRWEGLNPLP